ncbi:MAG: DUF5018 domain-containing protein [Psychroserpens sp.]|uniref:DUF5018 domain-containing protein n=1 Tax=Psychroserpens sp. TaxID=2020870 RepID=UPI0030030A34
MKKIFLLLICSLFILNCSKDDNSSSENIPSNANQILSFKIIDNANSFSGSINQSTKLITVFTSELDLSQTLTPEIEISENATISPSINTPRDFSDIVEYIVTAENGDETIYQVDVSSNDNKILSFSLSYNSTTYDATIDNISKTISLETLGLESYDSIVPDITISAMASISPSINEAQNFNEIVSYIVSSESGEEETYSLNITNTPFSNENKILSFQFIEDGITFDGVINHADLTIDIESYKNIINISPVITISDGASISPDSNDIQDFRLDKEYTVTSQSGSSNTYTVYTKGFLISSMNSAATTSDIVTKYYSKATPYIRCEHVDPTLPNSQLLLENDINSYVLNISDFSSSVGSTFGQTFTKFYIDLPDNIATANDYILRFKIDGILKAESDFTIDLLNENVPNIFSSDQPTYSYQDTLILTGENLTSGLRIATSNGSIYQYNASNVTLNAQATQLTIELNNNSNMFPSFYGDPPFNTAVMLFANGRYGETIWVTFE